MHACENVNCRRAQEQPPNRSDAFVAARYAAVRPDADRWLRARYAAAACLSIDRKPRAVSLGRFTDDLLSSPLASCSPVAHYCSSTQRRVRVCANAAWH